MKQHSNRIILCLLPVLLSGVICGWAYANFNRGGGNPNFRLGVDLVGGTILVYEVDKSKTKEGVEVKPEELAAALKKRIDPADLYNITVRPVAGDPPRVEIILPTGGR